MKLLLATLPFGLLFLVHSPVLPLAKPGQRPRAAGPDSTTVRLRYGSPNAELNELMERVLSIEEHRLELHDRRLAGRRLHITWQEYRRGTPGPEKELTTDASLTRLDSAGRFRFTIYARQAAPEQVENKFILPRASVTRTFKAAANQAANYSLRFDIHATRRAADQAGATATSPTTEFKLALGAKAVLAVYTLPYEHEGMYLYCNLAQSRVPVAEWYARFSVPHFVVYRARVE